MEKELKVVSVRLVEEQPIMSNTPIQTPIDAVRLLGDKMRLFDREVVCVINLRSDGKPICCKRASDYIEQTFVDVDVGSRKRLLEMFSNSVFGYYVLTPLILSKEVSDIKVLDYDHIVIKAKSSFCIR